MERIVMTEKQTRRSAIKILGLGAAGLAMSRSTVARAETPRARPNVLWLYCEDLSPWLPAYGDKQVKTPHLDRLSKQGVLFRRGYVPTALCRPSLMTLAVTPLVLSLLIMSRSSPSVVDAETL